MAEEHTRSSIRHFSLMNALLGVLNTTPHDSTENVLARYFLDHFDALSSLNVYEVAEACFTSRTGIRRFCQSIGLDNFSDLKSYAWEWGEHKALFVDYTKHEDFRAYLGSRIISTISGINNSLDNATLDAFARALHESRETMIITSDFSSMAVRQFQQSMLYLGKVVRIVTDSSGDVKQIASLGSGDMVVVVSEHGGYAHAVRPMLRETEATSALITSDCADELASCFDLLVRLPLAQEAAGRSVFAQYGVAYFLDLLYNSYYFLFEAQK